MAFLEVRPRPGYLFTAVMIGHVVLISAQVQSRSGVPVLEAVTFGAFAEVQRTISSTALGARHLWQGYVGLRNVQGENEALKRQLADVQVRLQEEKAVADRTRGLQRLLELKDRSALQTAAAEVIGAGATPDFRTMTIDKGSREGIRRDMAVIAPSGVVGRVVVPSPSASQVQLLIDRNGAAGVMVPRSRAQGVVVGIGDGRLRFDYVPEVADVAVGDDVVTSGIDGIYPKGFTVGRVEVVDRAGGAYKRIVVRPAVDFSALEEVLVVLTPTPAAAAARERSQ